ncbi:MAG TPA: hypothetical protein VHF87_05445 [Methylomirabilota bacterium]|jgi:hypothetical protein|nr:hypothetical protein [Methylomirabilota bacterium]
MTRSLPFAAWTGAALWVALVLTGGGAAADLVDADDDEIQLREVYIPHSEFQSYFDRDQLVVEQVTFVRVRRPDQSEALVAKEESGWEHVLVEGWRLTFYNQAKQALRRGPGRHVIVQEWSGGAHCCFDYHVLHVQGTEIRREGTIRGGDCSLRAADIDQDGAIELIACDARFAYAFDLPFADSPLVPVIYTFRERAYTADNRRFPQVYQFRISQERKRLAEAERSSDARGARRAILSVLLHTLYAGRVTEGWCAFDRAYRWADRTDVRQEVVRRLRLAPDPEDGRLPPIDLAYTLVPPGRCR